MTTLTVRNAAGKFVLAVDPVEQEPPAVEVLCQEYRTRLHGRETFDVWLADLGLPDWTGGVQTRSGKSMWLRRWRSRGRWAQPPTLFHDPRCFHAGCVVMVAEALVVWGKPVPQELAALAATALAEGLVRWQAGYP